jgi:signal peptidase I
MKKKKNKVLPRASSGQWENELKRSRYKENYKRNFKNTVFSLITIAAIAVLLATLVMPIFRIYGTSMTPTLSDGDLIVAVKGSSFDKGNIIVFYFNNKILVKRVIATAGEWVDIDEDGTVKVNGEVIEEPYLDNKAFGECNIELPYQVPEGKVFVMGDHRDISIDSRNTAVGCVSEEQIVGKLFLRFWPFESFEPMY